MKTKYAILLIFFFVFGCVTTTTQSPDSRFKPDNYRNYKARYIVVEGKLNGPFEIYEPGGQLQYIGTFVDDEKEGLWIVWEATGVKIAEIPYKDGIRNGPIKLWYGSFIDSGKRAGNIKLEANFLQGNYHGDYKTFLPDGKTRNEVEYEHGNINQVKLYDYNGNLVEVAKQEAIQYAKQDMEKDFELFDAYAAIVDMAIKYGNKIED
jgi:antitoxin component YwqK of YwqJK toxin-antitoxin module